MCGIAGFCGKTRDNLAEIKKMCDQIIFRGPDAEGYWMDENTNVTLGHRRLSILDLSENGSQPMISASGRFVIAYNGEIYNFPAMKDKLITEKHVTGFRSSSDTEVLLEAFEAYGLEAIKSLKGMFAIALYDRREKTLHLMRDRAGEKPLYYGMANGMFVFASDLASLTAMDGFHNEINQASLEAFVRYKCIPQPLSIYEHIYKLIPGQILSIQAPFKAPTFSTYWSMAEAAIHGMQNPFTGTESEAREELKHLLTDAVRGQMISDVPIGAYLSGGIDSPLVVSVMQSISTAPVKTFTIGFDDEACNEAVFAKDIAKHLGTQHTELYISEKELKEVVPLLPSLYSEPLADPACLPTYLLSKMAKQDVTVTLSGDGGDELFCGYTIYNELESRYGKIFRIPYPIRNLGGLFIQKTPLGYHNKLYTAGEYAQISNIHELHEMFRSEHDYDAYHIVKDVANPKDYLANPLLEEDAYLLPDMAEYRASRHLDLGDLRSSMLYRDQTGFMTDTVLNKVDRAGMAVSLENRIPLMDKDIMEFAWSLPISFKSDKGINKKILKELLYEYVPKSLLDRPKHGFEVPLTTWLSKDLHEWAAELIQNSYLIRDGYFSDKTVHRIWNTFNKNHSNTLQLWYILQAESWYRHTKYNMIYT